jgi:hypothetical protein
MNDLGIINVHVCNLFMNAYDIRIVARNRLHIVFNKNSVAKASCIALHAMLYNYSLQQVISQLVEKKESINEIKLKF